MPEKVAKAVKEVDEEPSTQHNDRLLSIKPYIYIGQDYNYMPNMVSVTLVVLIMLINAEMRSQRGVCQVFDAITTVLNVMIDSWVLLMIG